MALSPDDKFIYVNPDISPGEYNGAHYFPVKHLRGLECANAANFYLYFKGPKDAWSTRVTVSLTSGFIKEFFTQFVDEVNFGEKPVITLADRNISVDATTGGTDFAHVNAYVVPAILSDATTAGYEDVQVAEDLDVTGVLKADSIDIDDGGADINGTLEANVITIGGTNIMTGSLLTTAGTISAGVWNGTAVASAYLDADTAHLSGTQTFGGDKTFSRIISAVLHSRVYALPGNSDGDHTAGDVVYFGGTTSMTAGKCYYLTDGGAWAFSNGGADATATGLLAIALGAASDTDGMLLRGMVTPYGPAGSDDEGKKVYLRVQDGTITTDIPTDSGNFVRIVGYMLHASNDAIYFCPDNSYVEVA
mgnify:CR=1 FL=1